ncbi:MAG: EamA family transporter RarD [Alphaproteobacteria bacterium]|nr:EamA family transporter RarD [Alphaproteobacteria bacterium]MBV9542744.1 EamA family transporter RarD [Alphaproteobacteria bacterium]MBV9903763.1 EamA family transporter RarD [Alphaproteobacteria bacterium]
MATPEHKDDIRGIAYAGGAYLVWGLVPLYWRLLEGVGAVEITLHRILWCSLFGLVVTAGRRRFKHFFQVVRTRKLMLSLTASSLLITANWTLFMYCVTTHQLVEAAFGYYLTPLVSIGLGVALLGEKISRLRLAALGLATVAVAVQAVGLGHFPWIGPGLAITFGFYGYVRKMTPVDSLEGLTIETCLLLPITLVIVTLWAMNGTGAFPSPNLTRDALLVITGPLTALPLVLFAAGAKRLRLTTLGFLQYLSPSITLIVATLILKEPFTTNNLLAFACIWSALALVSLEGRFGFLSRRVAE